MNSVREHDWTAERAIISGNVPNVLMFSFNNRSCVKTWIQMFCDDFIIESNPYVHFFSFCTKDLTLLF